MTLFKRLTVVAVFFIVTCGLLSAQISIGARGGFNFAKEYVKVSYAGESESETSEVMTGGAFAGIMEIGLSKNFAIQPELAFIQKGLSGNNAGDEIVLNHIELPLLAKFKFSNQYFNAFAAAGPTFGYAMSGKYDGHKYKDEDWEGYNRFEIGASVGGGLGLNLKKGTAFVDVRYQFSLSNLADIPTSEEDYIDITLKNRGVGLTFGYLYRLGE